MIKKLRILFVSITMLIVLVVLSSLITVINVTNFSRITDNADDILKILSDNDGVFAPDFKPITKEEVTDSSSDTEQGSENENEATEDNSSTEDESNTEADSSLGGDGAGKEEDKKPAPTPSHITIETPFETRYFSVKLVDEQTIVDISHTLSVTRDEAISFAKKAFQAGDKHGYHNSYRYLVVKEKSLVIFIDWSRQLQTANDFLLASILWAIGGAIFVFLLVAILSKRVVAPIAEAYERQRRFIADAGHELKTPLTIISANNELLELTEGENEYTSSISKQVTKMTTMVKNLSALASIDASARRAKESDFSLSAVCTELSKLFLPVMTKGGRRFDTSIEPDVDFYGDEALIRQMLSSLLENAGKYALSYTSLSASSVGKRIQIIVSNDSTSINEDSINHCFERFYRSDEARASGVEGSGIGLCVAKEIVDMHHGEISALAEGDIFTIKIIL
ncbi:MAG: HAMP domain-containing histidine kinase [Clostridia bacterium]|nr:HAMP domain-containing histidine kinase [Clostridia bacterium]